MLLVYLIVNCIVGYSYKLMATDCQCKLIQLSTTLISYLLLLLRGDNRINAY